MSECTIIDTSLENISQFGVCGYKSPKKECFPEKLAWLNQRLIKMLKNVPALLESFVSFIMEKLWLTTRSARDVSSIS